MLDATLSMWYRRFPKFEEDDLTTHLQLACALMAMLYNGDMPIKTTDEGTAQKITEYGFVYAEPSDLPRMGKNLHRLGKDSRAIDLGNRIYAMAFSILVAKGFLVKFLTVTTVHFSLSVRRQ